MLQFSLRTLLSLTLLASVACALFFALPTWLACPLLIVATLALAAPIVAGVVYVRGDARAFAIGALSAFGAWTLAGIPVIFVVMAIDHSDFHSSETLGALFIDDEALSIILRLFTACWPLVGIAGLLGVFVRRYSLRNAPKP